ncbi:hypothetical protein, partial [Thiolapillus sp.]|uniref:hypothetical protein n=1 Tax=Thiolapillus sp. TaxID=2017437 RepID=UPI003AF5C5BF
RSEAYFVFPLAQGTPGKQCGLAATGVYQPSLRSPWLAANAALAHYQAFKEKVIAALPEQLEWTLSRIDIEHALTAIGGRGAE